MEHLAGGLKNLGIKTILIADDRKENIEAAKRLADVLPDIEFDFFTSGASLLEAIRAHPEKIDLVVTDNDMETPGMGLEVIDEAWKHCIPTFILSGGFQHGGQAKSLVITPFYNPPTIEGWKDNWETWETALWRFANAAEGSEEGSGVWAAFLRYRKAAAGKFCLDENSAWVRTLPKATAERQLQEFRMKGHNNIAVPD